jgi:arsenate reductase
MLTVYAYEKCDTCRKALKWLSAHGVSHQVKAIRETPPAIAELQAALAVQGGDLRRLFNTSGVDYRAMGIKDRLPTMTVAEALELLCSNGNLVKRPFLIGNGVSLVGFQPDAWKDAIPA